MFVFSIFPSLFTYACMPTQFVWLILCMHGEKYDWVTNTRKILLKNVIYGPIYAFAHAMNCLFIVHNYSPFLPLARLHSCGPHKVIVIVHFQLYMHILRGQLEYNSKCDREKMKKLSNKDYSHRHVVGHAIWIICFFKWNLFHPVYL